ncbi:MAG: KilA-N domain-containing protein [Hydrogenophaga sp.]|uniref:KilA-N domain-containing protein n=1 Tax=Hydrogenophaga sp. TaxID=1904254 RepID=UPI002778D3B4|nr:KilA-N domain-containing protein [Hydrogenophaga sp.]MDP2417520.1 KilA-N domain-containing protein [Hydrogenophaga sp.]MDZ4187527.1 KilA-N domain-containing protein [Hydrogenophaga sp.]
MVTTDRSLTVQGVEIHLTQRNEEDYISLTDMVSKFEGGTSLIDSWLRSKDTIEFLGVWERINNPSFNSVEFDRIRFEAGTNRFRLSVKRWTESVGGTGVVAKAGRYGGTFAHKDIAFEFGSWLSPEFKLYLITEFQRFKQAEAEKGVDWNVRRTLAKVQYRVHTDAVKAHLIPPQLSSKDASFVYASEADMLNKALFGMTAAEWKSANPGTKGNIRDGATLEQLVVLSSLESQNALMISHAIPQAKRLAILNTQARAQLASLLTNPSLQQLRGGSLLGD